MDEISALSKALQLEKARTEGAAGLPGAASDTGNAGSFALILSQVLKTKASMQFAGFKRKDGPFLAGGADLNMGFLPELDFFSPGTSPDMSQAELLLALLAGSSGYSEPEVSAALCSLGSYSGKRNSIGLAAGRAAGGVPAEAWIAVSPVVTGNEGCRSPERLNAVIRQFNVESNERYRPYKYGSDTYCNIFVWDVTRALGAEIPHYVDAKTGAPRYYPDIDGAVELDANGVCDWLERYGRAYGWVEVGVETAQAYANSGRPAVTAWKNTAGGAGHVQVVCPSKNGAYDPIRGVTVAQAGRINREYAYITSTYQNGRIPELKYYVHE